MTGDGAEPADGAAGQPRLTGYGHSWMAGEGATEPSRGLLELAAARLGLHPDNRGVGGSHAPDTAALVLREPPPAAAAYVVLTGLNDARANGDDRAAMAGYQRALHAVFTAVGRANPAATVIAVEQPPLADYSLHPPHHRGSNRVLDAYNIRLRAVAREHPAVRLVTVEDWDASTMLDADTVHPNDAGHAAVARAIAGVDRCPD